MMSTPDVLALKAAIEVAESALVYEQDKPLRLPIIDTITLRTLLAAARQSQTPNSVSASSSASRSDLKRAASILRNYADPTDVELQELASRIGAMGIAPNDGRCPRCGCWCSECIRNR